jgi:hypothetical protein
MTLEETVKLPDRADKTTVTFLGDKVLFVRAGYDSDCPNPLTDCDGMGHIYSMNRNHINSKPVEECVSILESDVDAVALSYFEHGNCMWMVAGSSASRTPGVEFQWDGREFAGVWVPDKYCRESFTGQDGLTRREWFVKQAECACEVYTEWVNGECYGYDVRLYNVRKDDAGKPFDRLADYRRDKELAEDSCWGFIGWEHFVTEMRDAALGIAEKAGEHA